MDEPAEPVDPVYVDLYKLAVEMAIKVSDGRSRINTYFLTVQTAFVAVLGVVAPSLDDQPWWAGLAVTLAGIALSASWWLTLVSYRNLNRVKFRIIHEMEERLPARVFTDEWTALRGERYVGLGRAERVVPFVFAALYVLLFIGRVAG